MRIKLTPENQRTRFLEDAERVRAADYHRRPDFSIGDHLLMLIKRCDALEVALRDRDAGLAGDPQGLHSEGAAARPEGVAQPHPGASS